MKHSQGWAVTLGPIACAAALFAGDFQNQAPAAPRIEAPLLKGLGSHSHPITTRSELGQKYFNQGLVLMYGFNHAEAIRSFKAAAELDPGCAMAWWGVAYCEGPNINAPMLPDNYADAWYALQKAMALKDQASPREQAYIDALATRYVEKPVEDRSSLDLAFVEAARKVARAYPDDLDAQVIFCEAIMNTMPWNYWTPEKTPKELTREMLDTLHAVLRRDPWHPGANHFYIHAVEAGPTPEQGIEVADRLATIAPTAGHLVHMPSHIYVRVGQYDDAAEANVRATRADESYLAQCKQQGMYPGGYFPHNIHFLWYANSLRGNRREAIKAAKKISEYTTDIRCGAMEGGRQRYLHVLALAQFGEWDKVLNMPLPSNEYRFDQGMYHFARVLARLAKQDLPAARAEYQLFKQATDADAVKAVANPFFPAGTVVEVADAILQGKLALYAGDEPGALKQLARAVEVEDTIAYMEPPFWYYSAKWSLGAAQIQTGNFVEAEATFRKDLEWLPRNGWALNGLAAALRNQGKTQAADAVWAEFQKAWRNADVKLDWNLY